jgi:hypothetical protein
VITCSINGIRANRGDKPPLISFANWFRCKPKIACRLFVLGKRNTPAKRKGRPENAKVSDVLEHLNET